MALFDKLKDQDKIKKLTLESGFKDLIICENENNIWCKFIAFDWYKGICKPQNTDRYGPERKITAAEYAGLLHQGPQKSGFHANTIGSPLDEATYQVLPIYVHKQARYHIFIILHKNNIIAAEYAGLLPWGPQKIGVEFSPIISKMIRDIQTPHEAAWLYCLSSAAYLPAFTLGLFLSKAYLFAGHNSYVPAFAFLIFAELLKYVYIQLVYHKDSTYSPKQGFKLFSILFYFMKQIKPMELLRNLLVLAGYTSIVFVVAVCFGAEVLSRHEETLMFSCLITILTIFPVSLHQGLPSVIQFMNGTFGSDAFTTVLLRNIQFTILGSWLGAFVIPLDWDREWQVWPIPCSFGALLGFGFSHLFSLGEMWTKTSGKFGKLSSKYR